jgi:hypothetical protein
VSDAGVGEVQEALRGILQRTRPEPQQLARVVENKASEKYDAYLSEGLLCADYGSRALDMVGAYAALDELVR